MRAVVFDLDGTLIDSAPDIAAAVNVVLAASSHAPLALNEIRGMIGDGAKSLLDKAYAARGAIAGPRHLAAFNDVYLAHPVARTRCYPGMAEAVQTLHQQGRLLGLCTNKPIAPTRRILEALGLAPYFAAVLGGDSLPYKKPDPRHLAGTMAEMEVRDAIMVGDHHNDLAAAEGLGLPGIFVSWGYGTLSPSHVANTAQELLDIIAEMG